jgi:hypothetical protein
VTNTLLSKQVRAPPGYFSFVPSVIPIAIGRTYTHLFLRQEPLPVGLRRPVAGNGIEPLFSESIPIAIGTDVLPLDDPAIHKKTRSHADRVIIFSMMHTISPSGKS